jgi:hypothetical protein
MQTRPIENRLRSRSTTGTKPPGPKMDGRIAPGGRLSPGPILGPMKGSIALTTDHLRGADAGWDFRNRIGTLQGASVAV